MTQLSTLAALAAGAAAPAAGGEPALPPGFVEMNPHRLGVRCDVELERRRERLARMEHAHGPGHVLDEFNALSVLTGGFDDPLGVLQNAAPDAETRAAAQACLEKLLPFGTELFQSAPLYARVLAYRPRDAQEQSYRDWLLEQFEDAGANLPEQARARVKQIQDELSMLGLRFQRNVNEIDTTVAVTPAETEGMSEQWRQARQRDDQGNYLVGLDYPSYGPFMESAVDGEARRRVWTAFQNRAAPGNLALLDRALALRAELAQAYGFPDYASFALRRRMAGTPRAVGAFLQSVKRAVDDGEARELEELRQEKLGLAGIGAGAAAAAAVRVERWDLAYLQQRIKRLRYEVDAEALRRYFPTEAAVRYVLQTAERSYGIRFVPRALPAWHADVRYYEVVDADAARPGAPAPLLGGVYLDLYPRAGKYSHAAVFGVRRGSVLAGQHPIKALVCNLNERGLTPAELETLFHEFGHALHGVLSKARYADQSGTAVRQDFVEAPSLMFEEWARREVALRSFAEVCPQCPALTPAQIDQLAAARRYGAGLRYARQWLYAAYDLALHGAAVPGAGPAEALATWERMEGATRLGHVPGTMMPAAFGHIMGGYEAGYYSYMWSEVLALDMLSAFGANLLDAKVGRRYRHSILEPGGSRPPQELVEEFLGRKPNADAFYAEITGQR